MLRMRTVYGNVHSVYRTVSVFPVAALFAEASIQPVTAAGLLLYLLRLRELESIIRETCFLIRRIGRICSRFAEDSTIDESSN